MANIAGMVLLHLGAVCTARSRWKSWRKGWLASPVCTIALVAAVMMGRMKISGGDLRS